MATKIFDEGNHLRIISNGNVLLIRKAHIKTVDTVRDNTVRLDIGAGALKNVFIKYKDVIDPTGFSDVEQFRDILVEMLKTSETSGLATEEKQDVQITVLTSILNALGQIKIAIENIKCGCNDINLTDETVPFLSYYGVAASGSETSQPVWSIKRVTQYSNNDIVLEEWADSNQLRDNIWDNRANLAYGPIAAS